MVFPTKNIEQWMSIDIIIIWNICIYIYVHIYIYILSRYPEISKEGKVPGPKRLRYRTLITTLKPTKHAVETSRNILNSQKVTTIRPNLKGLHEHDHPGSVNGPCVAVCNLKLPTWPSSRDLRHLIAAIMKSLPRSWNTGKKSKTSVELTGVGSVSSSLLQTPNGTYQPLANYRDRMT